MMPYVSKPVFLFGIGQVKVARVEMVASEEKVCECECRKRRNVALLKVNVKSYNSDGSRVDNLSQDKQWQLRAFNGMI